MQHFPLVEKLHTDVLEEKYGKIEVNVVKHNKKVREAHLIDKNGISRTFALTFFQNKMPKELENINNEIKKGDAIGKAFRNHKYIIRKNVLEVYIIKIPSWLKKSFKTDSNFAKARISEFYAKKKSSKPIIYGTVTEIYSPDFRAPIINNYDLKQISASTKELKKVGINMNNIWERIGKDNNYSDIEKDFETAKKNTINLVFKLKKQIQNHIEKM